MKCPFCGEEMESGELVGARGIHWISDDVQPKWPTLLGIGRERIGYWSFWKGTQAYGYYCRVCYKIIVNP